MKHIAPQCKNLQMFNPGGGGEIGSKLEHPNNTTAER